MGDAAHAGAALGGGVDGLDALQRGVDDNALQAAGGQTRVGGAIAVCRWDCLVETDIAIAAELTQGALGLLGTERRGGEVGA